VRRTRARCWRITTCARSDALCQPDRAPQIGDICSSLHKASLVPGGREVLLYTGYSGTVGMLIPFVSREDVDFFQVRTTAIAAHR
jgi:hypothetical protein